MFICISSFFFTLKQFISFIEIYLFAFFSVVSAYTVGIKA